ncbi:MAG: phosphoglycerate mutase [Gammaproteobacteria bacterium]|nr:phosphoglycerate mutase [Gammaproteobacteria bacterium]
MAVNPELVLLIPGLFGPRGADEATLAAADMPARVLGRLLSRAEARAAAGDDLAAALFTAFGMDTQHADGLPEAPLRLCSDGGDPGGDYCLSADPVHLRVGQDRVVLTGAGTVSRAEAEALCGEIAAHFVETGIRLEAPAPERWYLRLPQPPAVAFTPLEAVLGQDIRPHLPTGADARTWRRLLNEVQMLLHASEVNRARLARGEVEINSVWFWGGGRLPPPGDCRFTQVWGDHPLARGLALTAGLAPHPLPADAAAWGAVAAGGRHLIVLDRLAVAARLGAVEEWQEAMRALQEHWLGPLWARLRAGRLAALTIGGAGALDYHIRPGQARRWWRRARPFAAHARESRQGPEE